MTVKNFTQMAKGLERIPEGGERCFRCYELQTPGELRDLQKKADMIISPQPFPSVR